MKHQTRLQKMFQNIILISEALMRPLEAIRSHFWFTPSKSHRRKGIMEICHKTKMVLDPKIRGTSEVNSNPLRSFEAVLRSNNEKRLKVLAFSLKPNKRAD